MKSSQVCPFFRKDDDCCDVGCGYITSHDVQMMVTYCNSRIADCSKYQELAARYPHEKIGGTVSPLPAESWPSQPAFVPAAGKARQKPLIRPFKVKWPLPHHIRYVSAYHHSRPIQPKEENEMTLQSASGKGWTVALAGTGINLALGILYTWSIFKGAIADSIATGGPDAFNWDKASINDPYAVACLAFAEAMILAGKVQDKFGPKVTCLIGGLMVAAGFIWISQTTSYLAWVIGFGVLAGMGIGFGYSAATPPALKWFPPARTGLIAGIVVSGFGLASVYIAPLATYLVGAYGLQKAMMFFGIGFAVVVCSLALLISNPPVGFLAGEQGGAGKAAKPVVDVPPSKIFRDARFYTLWLCYFIGAGAGLMVIGSAKGLAKASMGEMAFLVVAIMAVGNAGGRLVAGVVSDKIGRANTLLIMLVFQAALMFAAIPGLSGNGNPIFVALLVTFMVFNYGTNLSLFPSFAKDYWGMKNFGMNYGILFSAWGIGAAVLVRVSEMLKVKTGSFTTSFAVAGVMLLVGAMLSLSLRQPKTVSVEQEALAGEALDEEELELQRVGLK